MASATALLERMTGASSPYGPLLVPIADLFTAFARSFWVDGIPIQKHPRSAASCMVAAADQVSAFCLTGSTGWADYEEILSGFSTRNRQRREGTATTGSKTSPLPRELVATGTRLILRDRDNPIQCLVTTAPIYPRRAWVGALHPGLGAEMPYVLAGMLNSTLGHVLYHRLARSGGRGSHDLRKSVLGRLKIPFLNYDAAAFRRAALISYRLHCLCAASQELPLPASIYDEDVPNLRMQLLSELVRMYGFGDQEARAVVEDVLPTGAADVPGAQQKLFYRPKAPLEPVRLSTPQMLGQYERLKERARQRQLEAADQRILEELATLLRWEHRTNSPMPSTLETTPTGGVSTEAAAMRLADRYVSETRGQSVLSQSARRITSQLWEVNLQHSARPRLIRDRVATASEAMGSAASAGRLWVNAITGTVSDKPEKARDAAASGA